MAGVDMFNAGRSIVALNGSMALYTVCLANGIDPHGWPRRSG